MNKIDDSCVDKFLNTSTKKFLFNLHYINKINKRAFQCVIGCENFVHGRFENDDFHKKIASVNDNGIGFITTHTDRTNEYKKDNLYEIKINETNKEYEFAWVHWVVQDCNELCVSVSNSDLFESYYESEAPGETYHFRVI